MKKTLVALAALASVSAFAQSTVTFSGTLDGSVYNLRGLTAGKSATVYGDGAVSSSVWGFSGAEDLGNGQKAVFTAVGDLVTNSGGTNASGVFRRAANVGLNDAKFGEVRFGITTNPIIATNSALMPVAGNSVSTVTAAALGFADFFTKNAVTYTSPAVYGLTAQLQKGLSNDTADATNGDVNAYSLAYVNGPLEARYAHQDRRAATSGIGQTAPNGGAAATYDRKSTVYGVKYAINTQFTVALARQDSTGQQASYDYNGVTKNTANSVMNRRANQAGLGYTQGAWTLGANVTKAGESKLNNYQARYALSKRTSVVGQYAVAANDDANVGFMPVGFNTGTSPSTILGVTGPTKGEKITAFGVGIVHSF